MSSLKPAAVHCSRHRRHSEPPPLSHLPHQLSPLPQPLSSLHSPALCSCFCFNFQIFLAFSTAGFLWDSHARHRRALHWLPVLPFDRRVSLIAALSLAQPAASSGGSLDTSAIAAHPHLRPRLSSSHTSQKTPLHLLEPSFLCQALVAFFLQVHVR